MLYVWYVGSRVPCIFWLMFGWLRMKVVCILSSSSKLCFILWLDVIKFPEICVVRMQKNFWVKHRVEFIHYVRKFVYKVVIIRTVFDTSKIIPFQLPFFRYKFKYHQVRITDFLLISPTLIHLYSIWQFRSIGIGKHIDSLKFDH